jgi:hypothetical protein
MTPLSVSIDAEEDKQCPQHTMSKSGNMENARSGRQQQRQAYDKLMMIDGNNGERRKRRITTETSLLQRVHGEEQRTGY